jgi:nucleoside-diphosphate-sugar epimerase
MREPDPAAIGLADSDFTATAVNGFGDPANSYVHSMTEYKGHVYAGTSRHSMALLKLFPPPEPPTMDPWPVRVPDSVEELDMHGQIWRMPVHGTSWKRVHTSPDIRGKNGKLVPRDLGYRGMTVFQGTSDRRPALYVGSISTVLRGCAARLLRSDDGTTFEPVGEPGLGNKNVSTLRAMVGFDHHLYVPPAGEGITLNSNKASVIMRSADPAGGRWEAACPPGFDDPTNMGVFEMAEFEGHLYAGTFNEQGYQVWKTPATGDAPNQWTRVVTDGAHRGPQNEIAMSMCVFDGALYVGSGIQNGGYDRVRKVGPAAPELIRIRPDDSWDLVIGKERNTPQGRKRPLSGIGPGFGNPFAGYFWRMVVHDGWLYLTTFDWGVFLPLAGNPSVTARVLMRRYGAEELASRAGGFEMWRTRDGIEWSPVTTNGFGNPYNYGGRTLVSTGGGLLVGTANPFAPETPAQLATGWQYASNPRGGAEVWRGCAPAVRATPRRGRARPDVLVTGATGFVGGPLVDELLESGARVRVLVQPGTRDQLRRPDDVEVIEGDIGDGRAVDRAVERVGVVVHLAALLPRSTRADLHRVNVQGTAALLDACRRADPERVVLMSSTSVYAEVGDRSAWPLTESSPVGPTGRDPSLAYGWSKVAAEQLLHDAAADAGFEALVLRPATVYGHDHPSTVALLRAALTGPVDVTSSRVLQYIQVDDLARVTARLVLASTNGEVVHLAAPDAMGWPAVQTMVRAVFDPDQPTESPVLSRFAYPYDLTHARTLGASPRTGMREGILALAADNAGWLRRPVLEPEYV